MYRYTTNYSKDQKHSSKEGKMNELCKQYQKRLRNLQYTKKGLDYKKD